MRSITGGRKTLQARPPGGLFAFYCYRQDAGKIAADVDLQPAVFWNENDLLNQGADNLRSLQPFGSQSPCNV
ncbi:hypothetical protein K663_19156 [Sphingobium sp. MI1205]|nr:hypothetical protein K663_19156 [Sphingobium sp. MI1205]